MCQIDTINGNLFEQNKKRSKNPLWVRQQSVFETFALSYLFNRWHSQKLDWSLNTMNICRGHTHTHCGYIYIHACPLYGWTLHVAFVKCGIIYDTFITLTTSGGGWRQIPEKGGIRKRKKCVSTQLFVKVALT